MKLLALSDFEPHINTSFAFANESEGEPNESDLILRAVKAYELHRKDRRNTDTSSKFRNQPFSLIFEGDHASPLGQRMYNLKHPAFEDGLTIFLSCKGPNEEGPGFIYEAVYG
jgi:hypothetical protein